MFVLPKNPVSDASSPFSRTVSRRSDNVYIPAILNKMIQLLLEEEREAEAMQEGTAPCIEFFLQSRILERLCAMAVVNKPVGMFQWIINAIARIIQHMKSPLLAHSSMHKPLVRLLSAKPNKLTFEEKIEVLKLINSLAHKLKEAPIFVKLFWSSLNPSGIRSPDLAASPPQSLSPLNSPTTPSPLESTGLTTYTKKHFVLFKILDRIYRGSSGDRRLAEQVRRCILSCIVIDDSYTELQAYLARQHKFLEHTINELGKLYATLSRETYNGNPNSNGYLQEYFRQLQFCAALCKIDMRSDDMASGGSSSQITHSYIGPSYEYKDALPRDMVQKQPGELSVQLAETMKKNFFERLLVPGLLSDDAKLSNIHTIFARETLSQLDTPELMGALVAVLVGSSDSGSLQAEDFNDPLSGYSGHSVQEALISRIEYRPVSYPLDANAKKNAMLSANTMRLFSTLCHVHPHNLYVAHHLMFQNLPVVANPDSHLRGFRHPTEQEELNPGSAAWPLDRTWPNLPAVEAARRALSELSPDPPNVGQRVEKLLEFAPLGRQTRDAGARPDVQTYHDYTKVRFKLARPHLLLWSANTHTPERKFPPPFIPEQRDNEFGLRATYASEDDADGDESRRAIEITHLAVCLPPIPKDHDSKRPVQARKFIRTLLSNLDHFLDLPLDFALYLTDTIASIIQYPHLFIHKWAYHTSSEHPTLFETLQKLSAKAIAFIDQSPSRISKIITFKESAEKKDWQEAQFDMSDDERFAQNVVLLDEFCKELLAILLVVDQVLS